MVECWNTVSTPVNGTITAVVSILSHRSRLEFHPATSHFLSNTFTWTISRYLKFSMFQKQTHYFYSQDLTLLICESKLRTCILLATLLPWVTALHPLLPHSVTYVPLFTCPFSWLQLRSTLSFNTFFFFLSFLKTCSIWSISYFSTFLFCTYSFAYVFNFLSNISTKISISRSKDNILQISGSRKEFLNQSQEERTKEIKSEVLRNGTSLYGFIKQNSSSMNLKCDTFTRSPDCFCQWCGPNSQFALNLPLAWWRPAHLHPNIKWLSTIFLI